MRKNRSWKPPRPPGADRTGRNTGLGPDRARIPVQAKTAKTSEPFKTQDRGLIIGRVNDDFDF